MRLEIRTHKIINFWEKYEIRKLGFSLLYKGKRSTRWELKTEEENKEFIRKCEKFCHKKNYEFILAEDRYSRSSTYRKNYLEAHSGWHGLYICMYCSKVVPVNKLSIDHIIPVDKAMRCRSAKFLLFINGIENVNDLKNLGPSCRKCNQKKSNKMNAYWILRARIGKIPFSWVLIWSIKLLIVFSLLNYIRQFF